MKGNLNSAENKFALMTMMFLFFEWILVYFRGKEAKEEDYLI